MKKIAMSKERRALIDRQSRRDTSNIKRHRLIAMIKKLEDRLLEIQTQNIFLERKIQMLEAKNKILNYKGNTHNFNYMRLSGKYKTKYREIKL
jgi:chromosome segregation ATPase